MATVASPYVIRPMTVADIPQVAEIERQSFPTMWPQTAYKRELEHNSMARYLVVSDCSSAPGTEADGATKAGGVASVVRGVRRLFAKPEPTHPATEYLTGFIGLWFMLDECHVVTVAVREDQRRRGIGELLIITAIDLALMKDQEVLTLECRVSNTGAQALYTKYGFQNVGVRRRYYTDNNEDALIMTTPPIRTLEFQAAYARLRTGHRERWGTAQVAHPELSNGHAPLDPS
jgi:ribosomal-protein-alanine N-acetyltransferase